MEPVKGFTWHRPANLSHKKLLEEVEWTVWLQAYHYVNDKVKQKVGNQIAEHVRADTERFRK